MDRSPPDSSVHRTFSRQEYWGGLPNPPSGDLPNPEIEPSSPVSPALQPNSLLLSHGRNPCDQKKKKKKKKKRDIQNVASGVWTKV